MYRGKEGIERDVDSCRWEGVRIIENIFENYFKVLKFSICLLILFY